MSTDTLHDKIRSEVERRLAIARAAAPGPWSIDDDGDVAAVDGITTAQVFSLSGPQLRATADFVALHDPADAIRRYEYALKVLDRHKFNGDQPYGAGDECLCIDDWPCVEITDLAESLDIDTGGKP